jgi:hypothetical protein
MLSLEGTREIEATTSKEDSKMPAVQVGCTLNNCETWTTAEWEIWGKLVKSWATGEDRLKPPTEPPSPSPFPWPTTPHELQRQLVDVGIAKKGDHTVPATVLGVTVLQMSDQHIFIVLPAAADITEAEDKVCPPPEGSLPAGSFYALPQFYEDLLDVTPPLQVTAGSEVQFNNCRTGEYVISYCG